MPIYRKKPAYRDAYQWHPGIDGAPGVQAEPLPDSDAVRFYVVTTHGQRAYLSDGDYVVKEPNGNGYYPCKAEIFEREHELVEKCAAT